MIKMDSPNPVVVVPVHRPKPTPDEQFSLLRCSQVLGSHPIRIVHPEGLNLEAYRELLPTAKPLAVPSAWMSSIRAYNRMMINPAFFRKLDMFSHVLIHEPDALVISDQLIYWCEQPFDYIGAPWFEGFHNATPCAPIIGVGNSGFSLLSVSAILDAFKSRRRWIGRGSIVLEIANKFFHRTNRYSLRFLVDAFGYAGSLGGAHQVLNENCDIFYTRYIPKGTSNKFKVADIDTAIRFAWEVNPFKCSKLCNGNPPFGIHAWARYDRLFTQTLVP